MLISRKEDMASGIQQSKDEPNTIKDKNRILTMKNFVSHMD